MEMEQHQQPKKKPKTELPEDIMQDEILTRLPLKSVLRFKCVCKPWRSLFSDSGFVKAHLSRQHYSNDQHYVSSKKCGFELSIISGLKETRVDSIPFIRNSHLIGSINGLICFAHREVFTLWNPAIRQYKEVGVTSQIPVHTRKCSKDIGKWDFTGYRNIKHLFGFGWDPITNDYKAVIVCSESPKSKHGAVYSCNSDSWTKLVLPSSMYEIRSRSFMNTPVPAVIVKECPYWTCSKYLTLPGKRYRRAYTAVLKFVAEKNEFKFLPDFDSSSIGRRELRLVNLKNCLAGVYYRSSSSVKSFVDVYSLDHEGSGGVWSKVYTVGPIYFRNPIWNPSQGKYVFQKLEKQILCYDPTTKEIKDVVDSAGIRLKCFVYTPSLVLIHGMKSIMHSET